MLEQLKEYDSEIPLFQAATITTTLEKRKNHAPCQIVQVDLDGTVYEPHFDLSTSSIVKQGNNRLWSEYCVRNDIPIIFSSTRNSWGPKQNAEMEQLGVAQPDIIILGYGRYMYVRNKSGEMILNEHYAHYLAQRTITIHEHGDAKTYPYDPNIILPLVEDVTNKLSFHPQSIYVDNPQSDLQSYVTLKIDLMSYEDIHILREKLRKVINGVSIGIAEDVITMGRNDDLFSGYMVIVPALAGKHGATRYLGEIFARFSPNFHCFGDASIDTFLAMGTSNQDPYTVHGYVLKNAISQTMQRMKNVEENTHSMEHTQRHANLHFTQSTISKGIEEIVLNL